MNGHNDSGSVSIRVPPPHGSSNDSLNEPDTDHSTHLLDPSRRRSSTSDHALKLYQRVAYSSGHVLNDLCASMWFSYILVYLQFVLKFNHSVAGSLLLLGQVADGISTPFVGLQSDKQHDWWWCRYGRRKTWHLIGTICVLCTFPFMFNVCIDCEQTHQYAQAIYYASFIVIFQFGWASVQISHLSLIPDLTPYSHERVELNALRYAFTVASNITVYVVTWIVLGMNTDDCQEQISPTDARHFRMIVLIVVVIGAVFSMLFHLLVQEEKLRQANLDAINSRRAISSTTHSSAINDQNQPAPYTGSVNSGPETDVVDFTLPHNHLKWKEWFLEPQFYKIGLLYMATRLCLNLSQVYTPLYLQDTLHLKRESIAYIPLVSYCSGFVASFLMKYLNSKAGKKTTYFIGSMIALTAYVWIFFGEIDDYEFKYRYIYVIAVLMGISGSTMLITSLAITNDLIGHNTASGAFVFGAMSFCDKVSNGLAVILIQTIHPCSTSGGREGPCEVYYRYVLSLTCGGAALTGLFALALLVPHKIGVSRGASGFNSERHTTSSKPKRNGTTSKRTRRALDNGGDSDDDDERVTSAKDVNSKGWSQNDVVVDEDEPNNAKEDKREIMMQDEDDENDVSTPLLSNGRIN